MTSRFLTVGAFSSAAGTSAATSRRASGQRSRRESLQRSGSFRNENSQLFSAQPSGDFASRPLTSFLLEPSGEFAPSRNDQQRPSIVRRLSVASAASAGSGAGDKNRTRTIAPISEEERSKMRDLFNTYDTQQQGSIGVQNLVPLLTDMGHPMREDQALDLLAQVDVNQNGLLDYPEFMQLVEIFKDVAQFRMYERESDDARSTEDASQFTISRNNRLLWVFESALLFVLTYIGVSALMLHSGADVDDVMDAMKPFDVPDIVVTFVLLAQLVVGMLVAVPRTRNSHKTDQEHFIASTLLNAKTFLAIDILSLLPMRLFTSDATTSIVLGHFRLLALLRLPSLLESPRVQHMTPQYISFFFVLAPAMKNLCYFVLMVHLLAIAGLRFLTSTSTYASSVYMMMYLISGAGFGDLRPSTEADQLFLCGMCVLSMLVNGILVGGIVSFLAQSDVEATRRSRLLQTLAVLNFFDVPGSLQDEILQFQDHVMRKDIQKAFGYLTEHLPSAMKAGLTLQFRVNLVRSVDMFASAHETTQVMLAQCLYTAVIKPEDYVIIADNVGYEMFFINYGFVDMYSAGGGYLSTKAPGDFFGAEAVFDPFSEIMQSPAKQVDADNTPSEMYLRSLRQAVGRYRVSAKTITFVELLVLTSEAFTEVMSKFPRFRVDVENALNDGNVNTGIPQHDEEEERRSSASVLTPRNGKAGGPTSDTRSLLDSDDDTMEPMRTSIPSIRAHQKDDRTADDRATIEALEAELAKELRAFRGALVGSNAPDEPNHDTINVPLITTTSPEKHITPAIELVESLESMPEAEAVRHSGAGKETGTVEVDARPRSRDDDRSTYAQSKSAGSASDVPSSVIAITQERDSAFHHFDDDSGGDDDTLQ